MVIKLHKKRTWLILLFVYLWLQSVITFYTTGLLKSIANYAADGVLCVLFLMVLYAVLQKRTKLLRAEIALLWGYLIFALFGLISAIVTPMQSLFVVLSDLYVCSRFVIVYFAVRILVSDTVDYDALLFDLAAICRIFAIVTMLLALHDMIFPPLFRQYGYRYFMNALTLFFPHPTYMAHGCLTAAVVLMAANGKEEKRSTYRLNMLCVVLLCILMCLTLRSKAIATAACILLFYFVLIKWEIKSNGLLIGTGGFLALIIGWDQFMFYFNNTNAEDIVRAKLHSDAVMLASRSFPLGTGFATFGSALAADYYSPLYQELGYSSVNGGTGEFLSDSFWPTVIAQSGWIGAIAFACAIACFVVIVFRARKVNKYMFWAMLSLIVYELITSIAESAFFNPSSCAMFALLGLLVSVVEHDRSKQIHAL